jgi:hypothetical protein
MGNKDISLKAILGPNIGIDLAAGSVGGAAQVIVGQPLDTIKTRAQIAPSEFCEDRCLRGNLRLRYSYDL